MREVGEFLGTIGNGDVKDVDGYWRMKALTGCDGVMIGRGAMGNPWLFRSLAALERGEPDPGLPSLDERRAVWRRHADLTLAHSPERMRIHELRKTLAWYSRGLYGGSSLRQRGFSTDDPAALLDMGEAFFADLEASPRPAVAAADPVAKSVARRNRRGGAADKGTAYLERVVTINRVAKVVQGGRRFSFTALVIVGDGNGMVGVGYGKAKEVPAAIAKGVEAAKKAFFRVPRIAGTIPHTVQGEESAGVVLLKPASPGTGVIAGGPVRAVLECAGVHDVLSRSLGSSNPINVVHATVAALKSLKRPEEIAARRGLPIEDVAPAAMLRARAAAASAGAASGNS